VEETAAQAVLAQSNPLLMVTYAAVAAVAVLAVIRAMEARLVGLLQQQVLVVAVAVVVGLRIRRGLSALLQTTFTQVGTVQVAVASVCWVKARTAPQVLTLRLYLLLRAAEVLAVQQGQVVPAGCTVVAVLRSLLINSLTASSSFSRGTLEAKVRFALSGVQDVRSLQLTQEMSKGILCKQKPHIFGI
jgi:hypothetical protein